MFVGGIPIGALTARRIVPSYLGQVATRSLIPNNYATTNFQFNSRTAHIARQALSDLSIGVANWCSVGGAIGNSPGAADTPSTQPATVYASIEYPAGTFTRLTWAGAQSGTVAGGATGFTDQVPLVTPIPVGATFWVRQFVTCSFGLFVSSGQGNVRLGYAAAGDAINIAASGLSDRTMGGTISESFSYKYVSPPVAILAQTTRPSVAIIGDSRAYGAADTMDASLDTGELARSIGPSLSYINMGCFADQAVWWLANNSRRLPLAKLCSHAIIQTGINDIYDANRTAAQILSDRQTMLSLLSGMTVYETTLTPETNTGNTAPRNTAQDNIRLSFNASVKAGGRGFASAFDVASAVEASSLWAQNSYQSGDGVHESQAGYLAIKNAGIVDPSVFRR